MKVIWNEMNEILPVVGGVSSNITALIFNAEHLNVAAASNHCVNLLQWTKCANVVSLRISFQQRCFCKAENPLWWLQVPRRYFLNNELRERRLMLIALILAESFLLELTQCDLRWKYFDVDAEKLIALLNNVLNNLMMIQGHEKMKPAMSTVSKDDATFDILNTWK